MEIYLYYQATEPAGWLAEVSDGETVAHVVGPFATPLEATVEAEAWLAARREGVAPCR